VSWLPGDRELLARFRAGERKALEAVYRHYAPQLSSMVFRGLATQGGRVRATGPFEVGAVVQETFARALQERARLAYDGLTPYISYLSAIARNHLLNERRVREEPADALAIDAAASSAANGGAALSNAPRRPDEVAEENELRHLVDRFLGTRTPLERNIFQARFVDRLTQDEAAERVGLSRIQVRRAEARLRRDLLASFKAEGYFRELAPIENSLLGPGHPGKAGR
jgi:RNA polymerase sigma-70 factor (ECF subfamily)